MKQIMCAVFDVQAQAYTNPQYFRTKGEAIRAFMDACGKDAQFAAHPEDYIFMQVGTFDWSTGDVVGMQPSGPVKLISGLDCVKPGK